MYLSRIVMDSRYRGAAKLLGSGQAMHAAVMTACPLTQIDGATDGRVLWRVDPRGGREYDLYVVSPVKPELKVLTGQASPAGEAQSAAYGLFLSRLHGGQRWRFRLTANPVRNEKVGSATRGRVRPHITAAHQLNWFEERASRCGITLLPAPDGSSSVIVRSRRVARFGRRARGEGNSQRHDRVEITMATYDGALEVTDPDLLRHCLTHGIGRAKAYGCGLMTLARL